MKGSKFHVRKGILDAIGHNFEKINSAKKDQNSTFEIRFLDAIGTNYRLHLTLELQDQNSVFENDFFDVIGAKTELERKKHWIEIEGRKNFRMLFWTQKKIDYI